MDISGPVTLGANVTFQELGATTLLFEAALNADGRHRNPDDHGQQHRDVPSRRRRTSSRWAALSIGAALTTLLNGGSVSTIGDQLYGGVVTLGADTVLSAGTGNVTLANTVDGAYALTVNSTGTTTFLATLWAVRRR